MLRADTVILGPITSKSFYKQRNHHQSMLTHFELSAKLRTIRANASDRIAPHISNNNIIFRFINNYVYVSDENKQVVLAPKQIRCRTEPNGFSIINFGDQMGTGL